MVVGVDSSKHKDKNNYGTGIAMVTTINDSLNNFYSESKIVKVEDMQNEKGEALDVANVAKQIISIKSNGLNLHEGDILRR